MKIGEIKRGMSDVSITGKIIDISEKRDVQTKYGRRSVAEAVVEDDTGQISVSLWENQIDSVSVGDTVTVSGAYVTEFREKIQLNIPRSGKIETVSSAS